MEHVRRGADRARERFRSDDDELKKGTGTFSECVRTEKVPVPFSSGLQRPPYQIVINPANFRIRLRKRPIRPNHVPGSPDLFVDRPLCREASTGIALRKAVSHDEPAKLLVRWACGHDDAVEIVLVSSLEKQWNVGDRYRRGQRHVSEPVADSAVDVWMHDRLEIG